MEGGFICLFRQFKGWQHYQENSVKSVFLDLLLSVSYEPTWFRGIRINRGCTTMSITTLQESTGLSRSIVVKALKILEESGEITRTKFKYGCITKINKFSTFQDRDKNRGGSKSEPTTEPVSEPLTEPPSEPTTEPVSEPIKQINSITNKQKNKEPNGSMSVGTDEPAEIDLKSIVEFFNKSVKESGSVLPKVKGATGKRVGYIKARVREYGIEAVYEVITKATASDFLNGKNQRGWVASFDWIMLPTNFPKVLEGNYDNRTNIYQINGTNNNRQSAATGTNADGREERARAYAATIARLAAEDEARQGTVRRQDDVPY